MRMRQSLAQLERAFVEEAYLDRSRRASLQRTAIQRSRTREVQRVHKHGSARFVVLVMTLILTAVVVTVVMFRTLYVVMG